MIKRKMKLFFVLMYVFIFFWISIHKNVYAADQTKFPMFGVIFEDLANYGSNKYSVDDTKNAVLLADRYFPMIRTMTDFAEGDAYGWINNGMVGACVISSGSRTCSFQETIMNQTSSLNVMLSIDNPKKWLMSIDGAKRYLHQLVYPILPRVKAIVVGWEVGLHISPSAHNYENIKDQVNNSNLYITNLLDAIDQEFNNNSMLSLDQKTYLRRILISIGFGLGTSANGFQQFLEKQTDETYNINCIDKDGVEFSKLCMAYQSIANQFNGALDHPEIAVFGSIYPYWVWPSPSIQTLYSSVNQAFLNWPAPFAHLNNKLRIAIGEIGLPTLPDINGNDSLESIQNQAAMLQDTYDWMLDESIANKPPFILYFNLYDENICSKPSDSNFDYSSHAYHWGLFTCLGEMDLLDNPIYPSNPQIPKVGDDLMPNFKISGLLTNSGSVPPPTMPGNEYIYEIIWENSDLRVDKIDNNTNQIHLSFNPATCIMSQNLQQCLPDNVYYSCIADSGNMDCAPSANQGTRKTFIVSNITTKNMTVIINGYNNDYNLTVTQSVLVENQNQGIVALKCPSSNNLINYSMLLDKDNQSKTEVQYMLINISNQELEQCSFSKDKTSCIIADPYWPRLLCYNLDQQQTYQAAGRLDPNAINKVDPECKVTENGSFSGDNCSLSW